ncbi:unnamed protein product [Plutella xylostella]|uniref:(diamondback moth) hypothetical protein n=1 Tax=Plutella xylostella TaxID=51655 RepID=A0A8S4D7U5_PLUXY|nr:uncharacterized protein LOC105385225 isoform X2 [Plutella xylostella]CAG9091725.1 unnamed protein product [Plutella xylostella]
MPASSFVDLYYMHDARNNFDAMRPAPVCLDANQAVGQCQPIHISTNCYYGYHEPKTSGFVQVDNDCEMMEAAPVQASAAAAPPANTARKRSAPDDECPQTKRLREEGMVPPTTSNNLCLLRPTHNNPDISRCLMVHMI